MDNGFAEGYAVGQGNMNNGAGAWGYGGGMALDHCIVCLVWMGRLRQWIRR